MTEYEKDKVLTYKLDKEHPHWIDDADSYVCSVCGKSLAYKRASCPSCGALMQEDKDEAEID